MHYDHEIVNRSFSSWTSW